MIWLHLSNISQFARLSGIPRTEYEIFTYFNKLRLDGDLIKFCTYDAKSGFKELDENQINKILDYYANPEEKNINVNDYNSKRHLRTRKNFFVKFKVKCKKMLNSILKRIHLINIYFNRINHPFESGDLLISSGLNIKSRDFFELEKIKSNIQLKITVLCYDIIPEKHPELVKKQANILFKKHLKRLARIADLFCCNSEYVEKELYNYLQHNNHKKTPIKIIPLGCQFVNKYANIANSPKLKELTEHPYLMFVSTIEIRKNHQVLYRAYLELIEKKVSNLPKILFVGRKGWLVNDFLNQLNNDIRVKDKILILEDVSDNELIYLYKNCMFTLFPSIVEGYGLPVAESLALGKYCLASNRSSLPEVGKDFIDYIDPYDSEAWARQIEFLLSHPEYVSNKEDLIRLNYRPNSWLETGQSLFQIIKDLE